MRIASIFLIGAAVLAGCQTPPDAPEKTDSADTTPVKTTADKTNERVGVRIETLGIT